MATVSPEGSTANGHAGLGLLSMRERLEPLGGTLTIRSSPGAGTEIDVVVPIVRSPHEIP